MSCDEALTKHDLTLKNGWTDLLERIAMSYGMGQRAWKLRTAMSLARSCEFQKRPAKRRAKLAAIYNWFANGFERAI